MEERNLIVDKALSKVFMKTTDFKPKTNLNMMAALYVESSSVARKLDNGNKITLHDAIFTLSGSVAELTIRPLLPCFGDLDFMIDMKYIVAIPSNFSIPSDAFLNRMEKNVKCLRMEPTKFPGYVNLYSHGSLSMDSGNTYRHFPEKNEETGPLTFFLSNPGNENVSVHGPATRFQSDTRQAIHFYPEITIDLLTDNVHCIPCPYWPPEARNFCQRRRCHGWPIETNIQEIINKGCDMVRVPHPYSRKPPDMKQWRLSFSRAEVNLIGTWNPAQKIIYHLLRHFRKYCTLHGLPEMELICNYHFKTVMLWNCEQRPHEFWNSSRLIHIICELLQWLVKRLEEKCLRNYFIPGCNLLQFEHDRDDIDGKRLKRLVDNLLPFTQVETLMNWFLEHYLFVVAKTNLSSKSAQIATGIQWSAKAMTSDADCIGAFVESFVSDCRDKHLPTLELTTCIAMILPLWKSFRENRNYCRRAILRLPQVDGRLLNFFRAYVLSYVVKELQQSKTLTFHWLIDLITEVTVHPETNSEAYKTSPEDVFDVESSKSYFNRALYLLQILVQRKDIKEKDLLLEIAESCFEKSLQYSDSDSIFCAANVYLAAINYQKKQYERALDLCALVIMKDDHFSCGSQIIDYQLLPSLDLHIEELGFAFLYLYVIFRPTKLSSGNIRTTPGTFACILLKAIFERHPEKAFAISKIFQKLKLGAECAGQSECKPSTNFSEPVISQNCFRMKVYNHLDIGELPMKHFGLIDDFKRVLIWLLLVNAKMSEHPSCLPVFIHEKRRSKDMIYSRFVFQQRVDRITNLCNSLQRVIAECLSSFSEILQNDAEVSQFSRVTDQYMALYYFKIGKTTDTHGYLYNQDA